MRFLLLFFSLTLLARAELTLPRTVTFQGEVRFAAVFGKHRGIDSDLFEPVELLRTDPVRIE